MAGCLAQIEVDEIVQAGDVFLFRFRCPVCVKELFTGFPTTVCSACGEDLAGFAFLVPRSRTKRRLLVGTRRKKQVLKKAVHALYAAQDGACAYCGSALSTYHVDHIIPVSVGGSNNLDNLCLACPDCNMRAGAWAFSDFNGKRAFILSRRKENARSR